VSSHRPVLFILGINRGVIARELALTHPERVARVAPMATRPDLLLTDSAIPAREPVSTTRRAT
jgi:hypothetical protein